MADGADKVYETMKSVTAAVVLHEVLDEYPEAAEAALGVRKKRPLPHLSEECKRAVDEKERDVDEGVCFTW